MCAHARARASYFRVHETIETITQRTSPTIILLWQHPIAPKKSDPIPWRVLNYFICMSVAALESQRTDCMQGEPVNS